jgi:hypothetical protein
MTKIIFVRVTATKKMTVMNLEDYDFNELISVDFSDKIKQALENFWNNTQLGYDKNGKVIRTDIKRIRPKDYRELILREAMYKKSLIENHLNDERRKKD